jgi:NAD(P)H-dependent FMN reductase
MSKKVTFLIASTRKGRVGEPIARWFESVAKDSGLETSVIDLGELNLPFYDAAVPPAYMPDESEQAQPIGIVSYGYVDGGASATSHLKDVLGWVKASVAEESVKISLAQDMFADGAFVNIDESLGGYKEDFMKVVGSISA